MRNSDIRDSCMCLCEKEKGKKQKRHYIDRVFHDYASVKLSSVISCFKLNMYGLFFEIKQSLAIRRFKNDTMKLFQLRLPFTDLFTSVINKKIALNIEKMFLAVYCISQVETPWVTCCIASNFRKESGDLSLHQKEICHCNNLLNCGTPGISFNLE